ncbi:LppP/LprE family lipoprotein [Mycolicibacterium moriokaense]|nr:LppP/LprE family lipoprotein [Mycolicibacterium moriokaense]
MAVRCATVKRRLDARRRRHLVATVGVAGVALLAGCGSGDSTVSKTPTARSTTGAPTPVTAVPAPAPPAPAPTTAAPDPCAVNLAAPEIAKAVSTLPRDPRSGQAWSPEPLAGTYNQCAALSAIIVKANTNAENPNTRAVLFHLGKLIKTGVPDTYGFNNVETTQSTGDTVALVYSNGTPGLDSVVKFRWNGAGVELIGNTPG